MLLKIFNKNYIKKDLIISYFYLNISEIIKNKFYNENFLFTINNIMLYKNNFIILFNFINIYLDIILILSKI